MKKLIIALPLLFLMACSDKPLLSPDQAELPDKVVYRTQGYYNAAVALETAYDNLPACPTSKPICSDVAIKKKIRKVDDAAFIAIKEAQLAVRTPNFGEGKVTTFVTTASALTKAFTDIAATLPKRN